MSIHKETIRFGHSGEVVLTFETNTGVDTSIKIEGTNFGNELFWISEKDIQNFTEDFKQLIERYFI